MPRYGTEQPHPVGRDVGPAIRIKEEHMSNGIGRDLNKPASREIGRPFSKSVNGGGPQFFKDNRRASGAAANGSRERTPVEELLLQTCAYELKGMMCPIKGGCRQKKICLVSQLSSFFPFLTFAISSHPLIHNLFKT